MRDTKQKLQAVSPRLVAPQSVSTPDHRHVLKHIRKLRNRGNEVNSDFLLIFEWTRDRRDPLSQCFNTKRVCLASQLPVILTWARK